MVIVRSTTVTSEIIELTSQQCIRLSVVLNGIEDRHTVNSNRDGTSKEVVLCRHGFFGRNGIQRNAPRIFAVVLLWQWDLLLPCRDPDHHFVIRNTVGFHVEKVVVGACFDNITERFETLFQLLFLSSSVSGHRAVRHVWLNSIRDRQTGDNILRQCIELFDLQLPGSDPRLIGSRQLLQIQWSQPAIAATDDHSTIAFGNKAAGDGFTGCQRPLSFGGCVLVQFATIMCHGRQGELTAEQDEPERTIHGIFAC